jgi:hypothetical protein
LSGLKPIVRPDAARRVTVVPVAGRALNEANPDPSSIGRFDGVFWDSGFSVNVAASAVDVFAVIQGASTARRSPTVYSKARKARAALLT